jgi:16S rRNA (guanine(966)-N(2))-methyltransferase RsmD
MRITGGHLTSRIIPAQFANHVRPSTDRVRESLFNTLNHQKGISETQILDLFSGSGIVALEFLSRGATQVISIDKDKKNITHQKAIQKSWALNQWHVIFGDALTPQKSIEKIGLSMPPFDIIFADPPYDMPDIQGLVSILMPLLADQGWLIIEHKPQLVFAEQELLKKEYGSTTMTIFAKE